MNEFYTVKEVAGMLKVSTKSIRNYINEGKLKAVKIGNSWRIPVDSYNEFIQKTN